MNAQPPTGPQDRAAALGALAARLLARDRTAGAVAAAPAARRAARHCADAARADGSAEVLAVSAHLLSAAGWILFDAGARQPAGWVNRQALQLADQAGDRATAHLVVATLSMREAHHGRPAAACAWAEAALESGPLPPRTAAVLRLRTARAHADAGGRQRALVEADRARSLFLDGPGARDPEWTWWVDEQELQGHRGLVLAALGDRERAAAHLRLATAGPAGPSYRSLFAAELLSVLVAAGAWREAEQQAVALHASRGAVAGGGSARTAAVLRTALRQVRRHPRAPAGLRDAVQEIGIRTPGARPRTGGHPDTPRSPT
ncbi:DNA-binding protein [Streptomyces sp. 549]|uniref:DNA-binding protein n=1 Tax=Streptomyces sp. 549 TaxID=3049076 RepID=UPI0024C248D5|nr:DNA-binding protein [Streptomyces sp. 549]MDK1471969.1 DNA-binding protein [Streptomyces sp. 549]